MSNVGWLYAAATVLGAAGMWLLLPRPGERARWLGAAMAIVALGLILSQISPLGDMLSQSLFVVLGSITVISAAAAVTFRNPVYCAIWFAMMLLCSAGLFLMQGAHFLGVATIVVYAGAILVTLLFVLMLASPKGNATYDRVSWEGPLSATAGIVLVGMLTMTLAGVFRNEGFAGQMPSQLAAANEINSLLERNETVGNEIVGEIAPNEIRPPAPQPVPTVLDADHSASLGARMFSVHLVSIEVAGVLLLAALVGAVAIVAHSRSGSSHTPSATERGAHASSASPSSGNAPSINGRAKA